MNNNDRELIRRAAEFVGWEYDLTDDFYRCREDYCWLPGKEEYRADLHALVGLVEDKVRDYGVVAREDHAIVRLRELFELSEMQSESKSNPA